MEGRGGDDDDVACGISNENPLPPTDGKGGVGRRREIRWYLKLNFPEEAWGRGSHTVRGRKAEAIKDVAFRQGKPVFCILGFSSLAFMVHNWRIRMHKKCFCRKRRRREGAFIFFRPCLADLARNEPPLL